MSVIEETLNDMYKILYADLSEQDKYYGLQTIEEIFTVLNYNGNHENLIEKINSLDENDIIFKTAIKIILIENNFLHSSHEVLLNMLTRNLKNFTNKEIIRNYLIVTAFSSFTNNFLAQGFNKILPYHLLSIFDIEFLKKNVDYVENIIKKI